MDSERGEFFVKEYQKWVQQPLDEELLVNLAERVDEANTNWALFTEDWELLDDQQKRAEKGNAYRAQLHFHKLMAQLYGLSFALLDDDCEAKPIRQKLPKAFAQNSAVQPTTKMMNDIIEPFLKKLTMGEATHQKLSKLKEMMESAEKSIDDFMLDKLTFEPIVAYFASRLLDEPTKIVIKMVKGNVQCNLRDVIEVIDKRLSIMGEITDVEMRSLNASGNSANVEPSGSGISQQPHTVEHIKQYCYYCRKEHWLQNCDKFRQLQWPQRAMTVFELPICPNCFRDSHTARDCPAGNCKGCKVPHNSLVCPKSPMNVQGAKN